MLTFDNDLSFTRGEEPDAALRSFWAPEDGFVWSKGKWCEITFAFDTPAKVAFLFAELILDLDVFKKPEELPGQNVLVYLNGLRIGSSFVTRRLNQISSFDPKILRPIDNVLILDTPESASPQQFGRDDGRVLGVQLFSVQIRKGS